MIHKGCGGLIRESYPYEYEPYKYELEDGRVELHPRQFCAKCGREIVGDPQIEGYEDGD